MRGVSSLLDVSSNPGRRRWRAMALFCVLNLDGCAAGPNFTSPAAPSAVRYTAETLRGEAASTDTRVQHIALGREIMAENAADMWSAWQQMAGQYPPAFTVRSFLDKHRENPEHYSRSEALADYDSQPLVRAVRERRDWPWPVHNYDVRPPYQKMRYFMFHFPVAHDLVAHFSVDRDDFVAGERARAFPCDALITMDGEWIQEPNLSVEEQIGCAKGEECGYLGRERQYRELVHQYLDRLPEDAIIVQVGFRN